MQQTNFLTAFMCIVTVVQATLLNETTETKLRVLGGQEASPGEFPFIVVLLCGNFPKMHQCGGSIIHPQWVLTAAHCLVLNPCIVAAGKHKLSVREPYQQIIRVESAYPHRRYHRTIGYDIALLKLEEELRMNDRVRSIPLPVPRSRPKATEKLTLAGWGTIGEKEDKTRIEAETLQKIHVFPVNLRSCRRKYKNDAASYVYAHNLCATGKSGCWGDSGGPLIDEHQKLIGVITHSHDTCSAVDFPDVYIRVSAFIGWIKNRVPLEPNNANNYKPYLAHFLIPLQICNYFRIAHYTYSQ